jgi:hypothetical protein
MRTLGKVLLALALWAVLLGLFCGLILGALHFFTVGPRYGGVLCLVALAAWFLFFYKLDPGQLLGP